MAAGFFSSKITISIEKKFGKIIFAKFNLTLKNEGSFSAETASKELVDEVFGIVNDRGKAIRVISMAKSAMKENLADDLPKITCQTLLIWGKEDKITPPFVGEEFHKLIQNSELLWMEDCGHAPMMEKPKEFNLLLANFLSKINVSV